jgi:hypothetical protein
MFARSAAPSNINAELCFKAEPHLVIGVSLYNQLRPDAPLALPGTSVAEIRAETATLLGTCIG